MLSFNIVMIGEQLVEVRAEGLVLDYSWSGNPEIAVIFPIEDGAQQEVEGWEMILHLNE